MPTQAKHDLSNVPAGPGAIPDQGIAPKPLLEGASEYEYVTIHNPLQVDFTGVVAQTRPVDMPFEIRKDGVTSVSTNTESDVARTYGLSLKNPDHQGKGHIQNYVKIESGKTINLLGNEAQVIVRQLVNEIMSRQGQELLLADAYARNLVEQQVIIRRSGLNEILGQAPQTIQTQLQGAVDNLNKETHEEAFAGAAIGQADSGETSAVAEPHPNSSNPTPKPPTASKKAA